MAYSEKQYKIVMALAGGKTMTLDEAVKLVGYGIYHNRRFYVGQLIARMIKRGILKRVKRGVYQLEEVERVKVTTHISNQEKQWSLL